MQDKLTPRQVRAWSLCALSVPAAMALPGCGWLWVLGGSILACALAACQQAMQRQSGLCMRQAFARAFGAVGGQSEIRTHGGRKPSTVFKTVAFNRSAICPSENGEHYI